VQRAAIGQEQGQPAVLFVRPVEPAAQIVKAALVRGDQGVFLSSRQFGCCIPVA